MSQGFTVTAASLLAGSEDITGLFNTCEKVASDAVSALEGMAGAAAGQAALAAALQGAAEQGMKTFLDIGSAYQHVSTNLEATASTYTTTEEDITNRIGTIGTGAVG